MKKGILITLSMLLFACSGWEEKQANQLIMNNEIATKNKASVKAFFKALEDESVDDLVALFAEDAKHINPYHSDIFPKGANGKEGIRAYWTPVFPNFDGMNFPIEQIHAMEDPTMVFVQYTGNIKLKDGAGVYSNEYYSTFKFNTEGEITEYVEIFNPIVAAKGFGLLDQIKLTDNKMKKVNFKSEGLNIVGNLYYPANYEEGKQYPTIVCSGSWTTVKEQMAGLYAERFAQNGFITLAFDFRNFGESEGVPRSWENPEMKIQDINNAIEYIKTLPEVDNTNIGAFGVCAGSMYTLMAAAENDDIKAVATTASWLHDAEAVKWFYGGEEGVQNKIEMARKAKKKYAETGEFTYIKTISTTDETAAMYGEFDYYLNPNRGAIPQWNADQFAVATWEDWLTLDPFPSAKNLNKPVFMVHSDGCVLPDYTKKYFETIPSGNKELVWVPTDLDSPMHQFAFYDQEAEVSLAVQKTSTFFQKNL
ncbi:nuclear transport factor 2 family protein [Aureisphaera galaxeae]|uniref:alpha/beta fold hydrolase n=1 Tax=Aureisphaera galaxeae TaxID=1538023 RepID=UPI00234FE629|nr:alpha/beta fold hydrolase [Aureisphaera galaxeae]MDC8004280.1 nuclear transport factor 2 family protein [Aureisphaera galaxeae]